jgi:hypothetical protein
LVYEQQAIHMHQSRQNDSTNIPKTLYLLLTIEIVDKWLQSQSENIKDRRSRILSSAPLTSGGGTYQPRCFPTKNDFGPIINPSQGICPDFFPNLLTFLFIFPSSAWSGWFDSRQTFCDIERGPVGFYCRSRVGLGMLSY